jgi:hypothetical protein
MAAEMRTCEWCNEPFEGRSDAVYCSRNHKRAASRARKRQRQRSNSLNELVALSQTSAASEASRAADARFRAMVAADQASRTPTTQAREWAAYARRHGTIHPDEQAARVARGRQARAEDWQQGTARFVREGSSVAAAGRRARTQQIRPMSSYEPAGPSHDEDLEAEMIDMGNFRQGRGHWARS